MIIAAIMRLAHILNMEVVAEGVETAAQLSLLKELKCDQIQRHLLGAAMNVHELREVIRTPVRRADSVSAAPVAV